MKATNLDDLRDEILADPEQRALYEENDLRRSIGRFVIDAMRAEDASPSAEYLAEKFGVPVAQARRLAHYEHGGPLTLLSVVKAAHSLGYRVRLEIEKETE